ncbi:MAG: hypothetical protein QW372_07100 [Nitrososphaerales archaeon]
MSELKTRESLRRFLYCSSLLEEKIAKAYEHISKLIKDKFIGCCLSLIAHDSFKHADCLRVMSEWLTSGMQINFNECVKVWGESWKTIIMDAERILSKSEMSFEELANLINGLMKIESFAGEEYLTVLHIRLIELMADEIKIKYEHFKTVLEWIIEDEKRHEQILELIKSLLKEKLN